MTWDALRALMAERPTRTLRGSIRSVGWDGPDAPVRPPLRVWVDGHRRRIEEADGSLRMVVGRKSFWRWVEEVDVPVAARNHRVYDWREPGAEIVHRYGQDSWEGDDFTVPTGPVGRTEHLGRAAWTVELAPPPHKPHPMQLVIDAETGYVLAMRADGWGAVEEWIELVVGEDLDPGLFEWVGPSISQDGYQELVEAQRAADKDARDAWFRQNVASLELPHVQRMALHRWDEPGGFELTLDLGAVRASLARWSAAGDPWELGWAGAADRWTDGVWEWALWLHDAGAEHYAADIKRALNAPAEA